MANGPRPQFPLVDHNPYYVGGEGNEAVIRLKDMTLAEQQLTPASSSQQINLIIRSVGQKPFLCENFLKVVSFYG